MSGELKIKSIRSREGREAVVEAIEGSGLVEHLREVGGGPFGHSSQTLGLLEALVEASGLGLAAADGLRGAILDDLGGGASFALPVLAPEHRRLVAGFQLVVTVDALQRGLERICALPQVEGALELGGLRELLELEAPAEQLLQRVLSMARAFSTQAEPPAGDGAPAVAPVVAFFLLLRRTVLSLARASSLRPLVEALRQREVVVAGYRYEGLTIEAEATPEPSGLMPVRVEDVVGNDEYLRAGLRIARDVAGYDLERRRNPKRLNPVLFGLGRPGCGKTVTAHAVGNYFLEYCAARGVPARFSVVRRTDWASSYQNASAQNLVRFFREEVWSAEGVCGVYWPDIDTAFASRDSGQLRQEEKQNLGAVFGVFDGTLLPRDGKWFLICDANNMHMDEATISRIAQNPFRVEGPRSAEEYVELMRGVLLRDVDRFLPEDDEAWLRLGALAAELDLSGRNIDSVCSNIRAFIQDFDYPDEYFGASADERDRIVASLGREADEGRIEGALRDLAAFRAEADAEAERSRFDDEVDRIVRHLNANRAAAERIESSNEC